MVDTIVLFMAVLECQRVFLFLFLLAGNPHFNQVVFCRSLQRISLKKGSNMDTIIKSSYGRYNRFAYVTVVNVGKFYLLFKFELHTEIKCFFNSLTRISSKKCEKMNTIIKSNYDRYNRLVRGNSVMLARFFSS